MTSESSPHNLPKSPRPPVSRRERGVALVVVLSCLILVCGLVLSFFMSVSTETKASKLTDSGSRSRDLIDTAVNVVMAQIRDATNQGSKVAWASQPGMIRTFGSASGEASSDALKNFKLYSAEQMIWASGGSPFDPTLDVPLDWYTRKALYTDINLPVTDLNGTMEYPIVDPSNLGLAPEVRPQGFDIQADKAPLNATPPPGTAANQAPMPVRWLYVLSNGALTSPTGGNVSTGSGFGATATWPAGAANSPSKENPIVGRVAFWTDDDSSKVNINTAFGDKWASDTSTTPEPGSYWDVPHLYTKFDRERLALSQPAQLEYQRYPGHPATTYLSAVFPSLTREQLGAIATRTQTGGSKGGTVSFLTATKVPLDNDRLYASIDELAFDPQRAVQTGIDRAALQKSRFFITAHSRSPELTLFNTPRISMWPVSRLNNSSSLKYRTPFDELIAFCAQLRNKQDRWDYYFVRNSSTLPKSDINIARNRVLINYLKTLTEEKVPGFGGAFAEKYDLDRDQILTEVFDYIRSTNLFDDSLEPLPYTYPTKGKQFTPGRSAAISAKVGHGQAAPAYDETSNTLGFGRFDTISEVTMHFICTADGDGDPTIPSTDLVNLAKLESNNIADVPAVPPPTEPATTPLARPPFYKNKTLAAKLNAGERRVEALFLTELFSAAHGWTALTRDMYIRVIGLDGLMLQGALDTVPQPLGFPADATMYIKQNSQSTIHGRGWGGMGGFRTIMRDKGLLARGVMPADHSTSTLLNTYPFASAPITIKVGKDADNKERMIFTATKPVEIRIYSGAGVDPASVSPLNYEPPENQLVQTIKLKIEPSPGLGFPAPRLVTTGVNDFSIDSNKWMHGYSYTSTKENWWTYSRNGAINDGSSNTKPYTNYTEKFELKGKLGRIAWIGGEPGRNNRTGPASGLRGEASGSPFRDEDIARSMVPSHGDYRLVAAQRLVEDNVFVPHEYYGFDSRRLAHSMTEVLGSDYIYGATMNGKYVDMGTGKYQDARRPDVPAKNPPWGSDSGDWDTGIGAVMDGPYINKPDEGSAYDGEANSVPYFDYTERHQTAGPTFFSPNRQVMSPVMFGSLPTQVKKNVPWRTLLFRPDSTDLSDNSVLGHIGAQSPKDHLMLDLFWMPVVEPYAISEPFSTAGKINLNYQIMPFTYIRRSTGLHALLRSERVTVVGKDQGNNYKGNKDINYRLEINPTETLKQFEAKFADGQNVFRSASEICEMYLVPKGVTYTSATQMKDYWKVNSLTGDNMKERPYASLYPRLTTKSNTYTVHYRVQALQQAVRSRGNSGNEWATWKEDTDQVVSEQRGSSTLERYIDPDDPRMTDYAKDVVDKPEEYEPLDSLYRFRVINTKRFAP